MIIQNWLDKLLSRTLATIAHPFKRTNGIIRVYSTFTFLVKSRAEVEGIEWEESFIVEGGGKELGDGIARHGTAMVELVGDVATVEELVERLTVCLHAGRGDDAFIGTAESFRAREC